MKTDGFYAAPFEDDLIDSTSVMAVIRRDFSLSPQVEAFVGLGLGAITVKQSSFGLVDSATEAGGQLEAGLRLAVTEGFAVFGSFKQQTIFDPVRYTGDLADITSEYDAGQWTLGMRLNF